MDYPRIIHCRPRKYFSLICVSLFLYPSGRQLSTSLINIEIYSLPCSKRKEKLTSRRRLLNTSVAEPSGPVMPPHKITHHTEGTDQSVTLSFGDLIPDTRGATRLLEGALVETDRLCKIFDRTGRVTGNLYTRSYGNVYLRIEGVPGMILPYFSYGVLYDAVLGYWQVYVERSLWYSSVAEFTIAQYRSSPLLISSGIFGVFPAANMSLNPSTSSNPRLPATTYATS